MKQRANLSAIGQQLGETTQSYIVAPLISAPNSNIRTLSGATRQIPDPSKTLKPAMGIERVTIRAIVQKQDEVGSNGESVFEIDSKDSRIRFVGAGWTNIASAYGTYPSTGGVGDYVEVTFYGTGLNALSFYENTSKDWRVSVDGGAEGSNVYSTVSSSILSGRNYSSNQIVSITSNLTLGLHTVRIRINATTGGSGFYGFEILNTSSVTNIVAPKGAVIANGNKYNIGTDQAFAYATGFDGNPSLNGRGGKVVVYATPEGRIGKVIQQVDSTQLNLAAASHTNEELVQLIRPREFGANRADDFSTLVNTASSRSFILNDGTTQLSGLNSRINSISNEDSLFSQDGTSNYFAITFIGTGLDVFVTSVPALGCAISIDGSASVGNLNSAGFRKIVSGLPYGTHTVRFTNNDGANIGATVSRFLVYGPKTPTIPDNAVKIAEYNLMATYQVAATAGISSNSTGVMAKHNTREVVYVNGTGGTQDWTLTANITQTRSGFTIDTNRSGAYVEYTFWGTGFDLRPNTDPSVSGASTLSLNGLTLNSTNFPTATSSVVGNATFALGTGIMTQSGATSTGNIISVRNLPLGLYRFRQTSNSAAFIQFGGIDIITPIHISANGVGSMSMIGLDLINKSDDKPVLDLTKAKAWAVIDGVNARILASYNISGLLVPGGPNYHVFFEKPFKSTNFLPVSTCTKQSGNAASIAPIAELSANSVYVNRVIISPVNGSTQHTPDRVYLICFGELIDE